METCEQLVNESICTRNNLPSICSINRVLRKLSSSLLIRESSSNDEYQKQESGKNRGRSSTSVGFRLCDLFSGKFGRYPGELLSDQRQFEIDFIDLKRINKSLSNKNSIHDEKQEILEELCRYGASELHSIAAFIGGCCAQEAIKLITHQYVPIDNTLIYNGIQQSISVFKI